MLDPDDYVDPVKKAEIADLDKLLAKLSDCDLSDWDYDFVEDMVKRLSKLKNRLNITSLQWEQLERMRGKYNV